MVHALLALALAANEPKLQAPGELYGWHFAAIPLVSYGSDVGLTLGGALFFYRPLADHPEEHHFLTLALSYATRGPRSADVGWGLQRLLGTSLRTYFNLRVADDDRMPYWGEGAALGGLPTPAGFGTPPQPYRYHDGRLFAAGVLRGAILGPLGWHVRARYLVVDVRQASPLLAASQPPGVRGGRVALGEAGLFYDSRDRDLGTRSGLFLSASAFAAPQLHGVSDFSFHGYDAAARGYLPLWAGATLAVRILYDHKFAGMPGERDSDHAIPFFERTLYEGIGYGEGLGGGATIRGIARYRLAGDEKILGNVQLRASLFETHIAGKPQEWGIDLGVDAGRARQAGYPAIEGAGAAGGLRFLWDHAVLLRVEMGRARGGDGTLYVSFGDQF